MIFIAMGANLPGKHGSPEKTLEQAKSALKAQGVEIVKSSRIWVTPPVPASDQPYYRNAVLQVKTDLGEDQLLKLLLAIEEAFGRVRSERNEPRVLDLDLLAYGEKILRTDALHLPHPRMHERAFVLVPLQEIAPEWRHPVLKQTPAEMLAHIQIDDALSPLSNQEIAA